MGHAVLNVAAMNNGAAGGVARLTSRASGMLGCECLVTSADGAWVWRRFPMPLDATTQDDVYVGRVRRDISRDDNKGLDLFVCGDQIKKGAALNAVQIAELVLKN